MADDTYNWQVTITPKNHSRRPYVRVVKAGICKPGDAVAKVFKSIEDESEHWLWSENDLVIEVRVVS